MAPETRLMPAVLRAHLPATSTDCPAVSDRGGDSPARRQGANRPLRFPGRIPLARIYVSGTPLPTVDRSFAHSDGARHLGLAGNRPSPFAPTPVI